MTEPASRKSVFVKYSCGCIGIPLSSTACILIDACDKQAEEYDLGIGIREMREEKSYSPISLEEQEVLVNKLGYLVHLGYRMKDLAWTITSIQDQIGK